MNTEPLINIPADIGSYLDEIAERLWSGHAAVMIGAGFSRNARKAIPTASTFPSWPELADQFYEKLHSRLPDKDTHYLSPLKLADEVQAAFGRPALDQLIRTRIPDKEYEPSDLHVRLLDLPWVDVFTVNYDTLLERACTKVTSQRFDVVVNKEDLVYSTRPRIVKLHGSFPSTRPLTISEEDYRRYPREQAPFVNTVQQSLLENTLCLIGFSGDDPNFLHWIGWVRDNLGKENSPKIYLIGVLCLTVGQRELLEHRNVVPIDLTRCISVTDDHAVALSVFLNHLLKRRPTISLDWPRGGPFLDPAKPQTAEEMIHEWRNQRESYPNWVVAPEGSRESILLSLHVGHFGLPILKTAEAISPPIDIEFLYELNWRLESALRPVPNELVNHYELITARYDPFPRISGRQSVEVTPERREYSGLHWKPIGSHWLDLKIAMLRFYREEALTEKWNQADDLLRILSERLSAEQAARWHYERCLQAMFVVDLNEMRKRIGAWPVNLSQPFWEAKRASLLAELGEATEAEGILEKSLAAIRSKQQLAPVVKDFTWVSQESHVMYLLQSVQLVRGFTDRKEIKQDATHEQFQQRWNELKAFKCDPWSDLKFFDARLSVPPVPHACVTRHTEFDIGRTSVTHHMGIGEDGAALGYTFLRYCEEIGLPFALSSLNIAQKQAQHAAERITQSSSSWAVTSLLRIGDPKLADSFFSRDVLAGMSVKRVDEIADRFIGFFRRLQSIAPKDTNGADKDVGTRVIHVVPEILSRVCTKCSPDRRDAIFELLRDLYEYPTLGLSSATGHLVARLLRSWSVRELGAKIESLLKFPLSEQTNVLFCRYFPEPFESLSLNKENMAELAVTNISESTIEFLLTHVNSTDSEKRSRSSLRLIRLYEWGLLNNNQKDAFGVALWAQTGVNGFPAYTPFYKWAFLTLPVPAGIDVLSKFKSYIHNWSYPMIDAVNSGAMTVTKSGESPVTMTDGHIGWCTDVLSATKRGSSGGPIDWSSGDAVTFLNKMDEWWNAGKQRLNEPNEREIFGSIPNEFRARYRKLVSILAWVISPRLSNNSSPEIKQRLSQLIEDIDASGISVLRLRVASLHIYPNDKFRVFAFLTAAFRGNDEDRVKEACYAIHDLLALEDYRVDEDVLKLLSAIGQQVKWRREIGILAAIQVVQIVVNEMPELFSDTLKEDTLIGLEVLRIETGPLVLKPFAEIADRLLFREAAASLAYTLFKYFNARSIPLPPELLEWQRICADSEEFAEIRNQWHRKGILA